MLSLAPDEETAKVAGSRKTGRSEHHRFATCHVAISIPIIVEQPAAVIRRNSQKSLGIFAYWLSTARRVVALWVMHGVKTDAGSYLPDSHVVGIGPEHARKALFGAGPRRLAASPRLA